MFMIRRDVGRGESRQFAPVPSRLPVRGFADGVARNRVLMARGSRLYMGGLGEEESWSAGLLAFAKSAAGLVNDQRAFNQQLNIARQQSVPVQTVQMQAQQVPVQSRGMSNTVLLGVAGVLGVILFKSMSRR